MTIHPDREEWRDLYRGRDVEVHLDPECIWTDGEQGGYCTEFYVGGVEIGNIVNTNGDCIDVGFGLERLLLVLGEPERSREQELITGITSLLSSGYHPSHNRQGYVTKKLLRELYYVGSSWENPLFQEEFRRQDRLVRLYERLLPRNQDKSQQWWMDTHGVDLTRLK